MTTPYSLVSLFRAWGWKKGGAAGETQQTAVHAFHTGAPGFIPGELKTARIDPLIPALSWKEPCTCTPPTPPPLRAPNVYTKERRILSFLFPGDCSAPSPFSYPGMAEPASLRALLLAGIALLCEAFSVGKVKVEQNKEVLLPVDFDSGTETSRTRS